MANQEVAGSSPKILRSLKRNSIVTVRYSPSKDTLTKQPKSKVSLSPESRRRGRKKTFKSHSATPRKSEITEYARRKCLELAYFPEFLDDTENISPEKSNCTNKESIEEKKSTLLVFVELEHKLRSMSLLDYPCEIILNVPPSMTVYDFKREVGILTSIPFAYQIWTDWPIVTTNAMKFYQLDIIEPLVLKLGKDPFYNNVNLSNAINPTSQKWKVILTNSLAVRKIKPETQSKFKFEFSTSKLTTEDVKLFKNSS